MKLLIFLSAAVVLLTACSTNQSTITNERTGYAIDRAEAKRIVESAIMANFSPDYVNRGPADSLTSSGYIRFALDTHTINATAIPVSGTLQDGKKADGFGFEVSAFGTMPISGGARANAVFRQLKEQAHRSGEKIILQ